MLAGKMRLKNFLFLAVGAALGVGGVFAGLAALGVSFVASEPAPVPAYIPAPPVEAPVVVAVESAPPVASAPSEIAAPAGREVDIAALGYVGRDLGTDKIKDAVKGKPWKLNVYQDAGIPTANRAKIDLDRDDKWDEKLSFAPGKAITREVAPNDDENYTQRYTWDGQRWVEGG